VNWNLLIVIVGLPVIVLYVIFRRQLLAMVRPNFRRDAMLEQSQQLDEDRHG
jgi:hypothetical protein